MIEAVLFDWSDTLVHFEWDDDLVAAGHRAALGRDDVEFTNRWREAIRERRPYAEILRDLGVEDTDAFIDAEHAVWQPATTVLASAQALLESLRTRGVKTGVVARAWPEPARVWRADAERLGLAEYLDVVVFSENAGEKPFSEALGRLGVDPADAMYVGDKLIEDVQGASNLGMTTVQALWFVADDTPPAVEPDFMAFTPMDVLNAVRRLAL